ncbi:MAG TPA: ACP S-malonyltransferase [Candidatus Limnocylindria bacterium]|nr:ACP S-malonyltransferase [Candidatus Limnocylindria bacterium]
MSLALLFSPQGSQVPGMGRELASISPTAAAAFTVADATLGWSVSDLCFNGPAERLNDTRQTQPCLVTASIAAWLALEEARAARGDQLRPAFVAGHSVGEVAALAAGGVLSVADAVRLAAERGRLMADAAVGGGMIAVIGLDRHAVGAVVEARAAGDDLVIANDNAPGQVVISGSEQALAAVAEPLRQAGARRAIRLRVSGPFHSPAMRRVGEELRGAFDGLTWHDARVPVVSNVTAEPVTDSVELRGLLARQVSAPVEWVHSMRRLIGEGVDTFVECGPGGTLVGMLRRIAPDVRALSVSDAASLEATVAALDGLPVGAAP